MGEPGWGWYEQERRGSVFSATLKVLHGTGIEIAQLDLPISAPSKPDVRIGGRQIEASFEGKHIVLAEPATLGPGSEIRVSSR